MPSRRFLEGLCTGFMLTLVGCGTEGPSESSPASLSQENGDFSQRLDHALRIQAEHGHVLRQFDRPEHDVDDIRNGRIPAPEDDSVVTQQLINLVSEAEDYSEAILLVRVAGQPADAPPPVPQQLSARPDDPDWEFNGYNVRLPFAVAEALRLRREARNDELLELTDTEFDRYAADLDARHQVRRRMVAAALGWSFDERDDLYVAEADDQTWRRKKSADWRPSQLEGEAGIVPSDPNFVPEEDSLLPEGVHATIFGTDNRGIRSGWNGYTMQGSVWRPKGAIVDDGRTTQEVPVEVDCTGVKIRPRLVITAGHCQFQDGSWNDNTKWIPGADGIAAEMNGTDPSPNGYKNRYTRIVRGQWSDHEWINYDFGLFVLHDNSSSCALPYHGWRKRTAATMNGRYIHLYGYPGERRDCAASPLTNDWCNGSIYGAGGSITYAGAYRVRYTIDTQPGTSGTGYYEIDNGGRYVLGVNTHQNSSYNSGTWINNGNRNMIVDAKADYPPNACN